MDQCKQKSESVADSFPFKIFLIYIVFYAGQAIYNCYANLFMDAHGFSQMSIGFVSSISTIILVLFQPILGVWSDKSKNKCLIVSFLIGALGITCLAIYLSKNVVWLAICMVLFSFFFSTAITLQDNSTLEILERSKWDFGNIRLGGTLGYAACAAIIGFFVAEPYDNIFWMVAIFCFAATILTLTLPKVKGVREKHDKVKYSLFFRNRPLMVLIIFNIIYGLSGSFTRFYSIYYRNDLGATTQMVGIMTMVSALSEVPFFWFAGKIQRKMGVGRFILLAAVVSTIRMLLIYWITDPALVILVQVLSGCGFAVFNFCLLNFINDSIPKKMRATAQTFNATLGIIFSSILFAPIVGALADIIGSRTILFIGGIIMALGTLFFALAFGPAVRYQKEHPLKLE